MIVVSLLVVLVSLTDVPSQAAPFALFLLLAVFMWMLYRRTESGQFRKNSAAKIANAAGALLWAAGAAGSAWCFWHHVCMAGHMQHPPYPSWHYAVDIGWVVSLIVAAIWTRVQRASLCIGFAFLSSFLVSYRFLFGSFGGAFPKLPL
jgi:hypothetical protein